MYIEKIRQEIDSHIGDKVTIQYNLGRNKIEKYDVKIKETFDYVFLVKLIDRDEIRSFSYIDIITKTVKIDY